MYCRSYVSRGTVREMSWIDLSSWEDVSCVRMLSRAKRSETDRSTVERSRLRLGDGKEEDRAVLMNSEMEVDASSEVTSFVRSEVEPRDSGSSGFWFKTAMFVHFNREKNV
jgi:hypothetical protein